jgi:hypothetical protein
VGAGLQRLSWARTSSEESGNKLGASTQDDRVRSEDYSFLGGSRCELHNKRGQNLGDILSMLPLPLARHSRQAIGPSALPGSGIETRTPLRRGHGGFCDLTGQILLQTAYRLDPALIFD